ncbi:hypothetical protein F5Y18DRAFT_323828 [Xylariaceae sp. FL1019]|nr:hypothetical protein F5Y18DRAFT_323828 [Xylariaceae sp. FL1019]
MKFDVLLLKHPDTPLKGTTRGGEEYDIDRLDELTEEAEAASKDEIYKSIDLLINDIYGPNDIKYVLMGGIAMQLYGYSDRETTDSDMIVSVNSRDMLEKIKDHPDITRPNTMLSLSGALRIFINIEEQQVEADLFVQGNEMAPSLDDAQEIDGYNVLGLVSLLKSKLKRMERKDKEDIMWFIDEKGSDVSDVADDIDKDRRIEFAQEVMDNEDIDEADDENGRMKLVRETFKLEKKDVYDDDD